MAAHLKCLIIKTLNDPTAFWTLILATATILLFLIAWRQLTKIAKTGSADFIHRFKIDFFTQETRELIMLIDQECLIFKEDDFPYFEVQINSSLPEIVKCEIKKNFYTGYEVDDLFLGHFEDLGLFEKKKFIDIQMVYEFFDWYIETAWENKEINKYVENQRKNIDSHIYENFQSIYKKCKSYGEKKGKVK